MFADDFFAYFFHQRKKFVVRQGGERNNGPRAGLTRYIYLFLYHQINELSWALRIAIKYYSFSEVKLRRKKFTSFFFTIFEHMVSMRNNIDELIDLKKISNAK